ncbi:hypothetical protein P3T37_003615 [Kitasatospora sp. MAA4]|uniref:hypothetical protein n=1 Tax=Kitasatospora sp. MAA4 TaxID=3035093 RepID=UPI002473B198|nr:hypothetical protein [Kitasatospora sp. MAA4]MDH6134213.1 hypothetical protein [Kitasatospora sp. MAA4]
MMTKYLPRFPEELGRAREAVLSLAAAEGAAAAYIGGALAAGLGTPMSDVDVYFVVPDGKPSAARQIFVDGRRYDIGYQSTDSLRALVDQISDYRADRDDLGILTAVGRKSLDPVVRFLLSETVVDDGSIKALQDRARESISEIVRTMVGVMSFEVHNALEDAHGFHAVGDLQAASWALRSASLSAAEALLASRGDLYLGHKWVWARWARTFGSEIPLPSPAAAAAEPVAFGESVAVCQDLLIQAITGASYEVKPSVAPGALSRAPMACAVPLSGSVLVYLDGSDAAEISREGLLLLGLAHGRTRADAVSLTAGQLRSGGAQVTEAEVADYLDDFVEAGLLTVKA